MLGQVSRVCSLEYDTNNHYINSTISSSPWQHGSLTTFLRTKISAKIPNILARDFIGRTETPNAVFMVLVKDVEMINYLYPTYHGNSLYLQNFPQKLEPKIFNWPKVMNFLRVPW